MSSEPEYLPIGYEVKSPNNGPVYTIKQHIGKGGYATVQLALNTQQNQEVAIKYQQNIQKDELEFLQQVKQQKFKNAIIIKDVFQVEQGENSLCFIVMDVGKQGNLLERIQQARNNPITESEMSNIFRQLAIGVRELHELGILHRDIKPENIVICKENNELVYKFCDFGAAKYFNPIQSGHTQGRGTPNYMAPEIIDTEDYTKAVDVWSLGAVFYELYAHELLFNGKDRKEIYDNVRKMDTTRLIDQHVKNQKHNKIVQSMLVRQFEDRIAINDLIAELGADFSSNIEVGSNSRTQMNQIQEQTAICNFSTSAVQIGVGAVVVVVAVAVAVALTFGMIRVIMLQGKSKILDIKQFKTKDEDTDEDDL